MGSVYFRGLTDPLHREEHREDLLKVSVSSVFSVVKKKQPSNEEWIIRWASHRDHRVL
jgi:hypothetical protein